MAKADHADAHRQHPLAEEGELAAVVSLRNPGAQFSFGFVPTTQLFGSADAVLLCNFLFACYGYISFETPKNPMCRVAPRPLFWVAVGSFAEGKSPKKRKRPKRKNPIQRAAFFLSEEKESEAGGTNQL